MDVAFLISALLVVSATITLTVEAIKKIVKSMNKDCNSTVLAVIVSVVVSTACSVGYVIYNSLQFDAKIVVVIVAFVFLSFLCATVGYDKVIKEIFRKNSK